MSDAASTLDVRAWPITGVDIETRRRRVLAALAAMGRTAEQAQFRRRVTASAKVAMAVENYKILDDYVQAWYEHVILLQTDPEWAAKWDEDFNHPPPRDPGHALPIEEAIARLGGPA